MILRAAAIGLASFIKCEQLEKIDFGPGLREIGKGAFSACTGLKSLVIPPNVKVIGEQAFFGCDGVTDLTLPEGVEIGPRPSTTASTSKTSGARTPWRTASPGRRCTTGKRGCASTAAGS